MKSKFLTANILFIISGSFLGCCGTREIKCPDGETVIVQNCPEKQYMQTVETTNTNLKATVDVLKKVNVDVDAGVKRKVTELREKLDQFSSRTQDIIKASYNALQTTPCDKEVRKRHFDLLDGIAKENSALEKLRAELNDLSKKGNIGGIDESKLESVIDQYNSTNAEVIFVK